MSRDREVHVHPSPDAWIDWVEDRLQGPARDRLEEHLRACGACREREGEVRRVLQALAADQLLEPSDLAVAAALRAFRRPRRETIPDRARHLARLVFDSLARPAEAFAGARNAGVSRRLRFEAGDEELDVEVVSEGDRRRLTGQLLSLSSPSAPRAGVRITVAAAGQPEFDGRTGSHGEFSCELANPGEIEIRRMDDRKDPGEAVRYRIPEDPGDPDI